MSALLQLHRALAAGNTLPWVLKYAPDGDRDAALAKAWNEEQNIRTMSRFCEQFRKQLVKSWCGHPRLSVGPFVRHCKCRGLPRVRHVCATCCNDLRELVRPPTWAEVEK